eukprot:4430726-Alexandrium_andersonii.AAC.1
MASPSFRAVGADQRHAETGCAGADRGNDCRLRWDGLNRQREQWPLGDTELLDGPRTLAEDSA